MEPANLIPPDDRDAELDAWLRERATPLADLGFSARVAAALPAESRRRVARERFWFAAAGGCVGVVVALIAIAISPSAGDALHQLDQVGGYVAAQFADPTVLLALVFAAGSVAFVFRKRALRLLVR